MKTLEQIKKDKNYLAASKGYPMDPEGFTLTYLIGRFCEEGIEFTEACKRADTSSTIKLENRLDILDELADMSNFIDYIATKLIVFYPDKYRAAEEGLG